MKLNPETIKPYFNTLLIRQDKAEEKFGSILKPDSAIEADNFAIMTGTVSAVGPTAFSYNTPGTEEYWVHPDKPVPGDRVYFRKYAGGQMLDGEDGEKYRFIDHMDIIGKIGDA